MVYVNFKWRTRRWDRVPPRDFWPGNFCWPTGEKEARKKGERGGNWEEKKENCKREGGKLKMEGGKVTKWGEHFCFSLLKTTKICFVSTKMEIFYREKAFHAGKKIRENDFAPSGKFAQQVFGAKVVGNSNTKYVTEYRAYGSSLR